MRIRLWLVAGGLLAAGAAAAAEPEIPAGRWTRLAEPAPDPLGREMNPGMGAAWAWVPEMKAFILYGGRTPAAGNGLWSFDPANKEWKRLLLCDRLQEDPKTRELSVRKPGEIPWAKDRPAPGSDYGAVYVPELKAVLLAGGWRYDGAGDWGGTRFGTWRFDGVTGTFAALSEEAPGSREGWGWTLRLAYDPKSKLVIATPQIGRGKEGETSAPNTTWVFSPSAGKWEKRAAEAGPRGGAGHPALAFDEKAGLVVYFDAWGQTWTYDPARNAWKDAKPGNSPKPRRHAGSWFDPEAGRVFLHGGISQAYPGKGHTPGREDYVSFYTSEWGLQYSDLWSYDAGKNEWQEEKSEGAAAPGKNPVFRDLCVYAPELKAAVLYEPTTGVWAYRWK
jgi:hypothetical protein